MSDEITVSLMVGPVRGGLLPQDLPIVRVSDSPWPTWLKQLPKGYALVHLYRSTIPVPKPTSWTRIDITRQLGSTAEAGVRRFLGEGQSGLLLAYGLNKKPSPRMAPDVRWICDHLRLVLEAGPDELALTATDLGIEA